MCQHLTSVSHEIRESQIHLKTTRSCFISINQMVNVPVRAGSKGVVHTMMGKSTSLPAGSAVKSRFMLITRVIGLYSSFTSLPTKHLPADRKSLPSLLHESPTQMFLGFSLSPFLCSASNYFSFMHVCTCGIFHSFAALSLFQNLVSSIGRILSKPRVVPQGTVPS